MMCSQTSFSVPFGMILNLLNESIQLKGLCASQRQAIIKLRKKTDQDILYC